MQASIVDTQKATTALAENNRYAEQIRIKINGGHDLTETEIRLQQVMAFLQDKGVGELDRINIYLFPKRGNRESMDFGAHKTPNFEVIADRPEGAGDGNSGKYGRKR